MSLETRQRNIFFNVIDDDLYRAVVLSLEDEYGVELNQADYLNKLIEVEKIIETRKR